jgi:hypothetical protein
MFFYRTKFITKKEKAAVFRSFGVSSPRFLHHITLSSFLLIFHSPTQSAPHQTSLVYSPLFCPSMVKKEALEEVKKRLWEEQR